MNNTSFQQRTDQLITLSVKNHCYAFERFEWPDQLTEDEYWLSPDALSIAGTEFESTLSESQKIKLSKWECVNIFSLNNTGERELIQEVSRVMHELPIGTAKEYLNHLISEENQHMWYFNKFCHNYAGKVYPNKKLRLKKQKISKALDHFLVFARVLIFEEIGHYFNIANAKDQRVNEFVREINQAHYNEEARHITFGRRILEPLAEEALSTEEVKDMIIAELNQSVQMNLQALYNPSMYRDTGLESPMQIRQQLLDDEHRQKFHHTVMLKGVHKVFKKLGLELESTT